MAVVDAGGNIFTHINGVTVRAELCTSSLLGCSDNPGGSLLTIGDTSSYNVSMINGRAVFNGLSIDVAGHPYYMIFYTDFVFNDTSKVTYVVSSPITVGVGRAAVVRIEQELDGARGGIPFAVQPRVSVRDAGGNVVTEQPTDNPKSIIVVSLSNNPNGGSLYSLTTPLLKAELVDGFLNFSGLTIDKVGVEYELEYKAEMRNVLGEEYEVSTFSSRFGVNLGEAASLSVVTPISGAWAGGLPFVQQPEIELLDAGKNRIVTDSSSVITVELTNSPSGYNLTGPLNQVLFEGLAVFSGLTLIQVGVGYEITLSCSCGNFTTVSTFDVVPSAEFEVMSHDGDPGDKFGYSSSIYGTTAVAGAPDDNRPILEVQRVTSSAETTATAREIQTVTTRGVHQAEKQEIKSCGAGGGVLAIQGYFVLSWNGISTRPLRYDIHPSVMKAYLEADIPGVGQVTVIKTVHYDCDAVHTYTWLVSFDTLEGEISQLEVDYSGVNGTFTHSTGLYDAVTKASTALNASISVTTLTNSPVLSGSFRLRVGADGTSHGEGTATNVTALIPFNATSVVVRAAIEDAIGTIIPQTFFSQTGLTPPFRLVGVTRSGPDVRKGYTWSVTFPLTEEIYDWRELESVEANEHTLNGVGASLAINTVQKGELPIRGYFNMYFKDNGPSDPIEWNETAAGMKAKLEGLQTIDEVQVSRVGPLEMGGYTWVVTFVRTRTPDQYGFTADQPGNLPALIADTTGLRGTDARIIVEFVYGVDDMDTIYCQHDYNQTLLSERCSPSAFDQYLVPNDRPIMGKSGEGAGAAYVIVRDAEKQIWETVAKLRGSDTKSYDQFGFSVCFDNSTSTSDDVVPLAVVGAPYASDEGDMEVQTVLCRADSGTLAFRFRSQVSAYFTFNITAVELEIVLEQMRSITDVIVSFDGGVSLCSAAGAVTASIGFVTPSDGDMPELEPVLYNPSNPSTPALFDSTAAASSDGYQWGTVTVTESVMGTLHSKTGSDGGYSTGGAYVFEPDGNDITLWTETTKLVPADAMAGDAFGYSVSGALDTIVVGAPEHDYDSTMEDVVDGAGAIYVFTRERLGGSVGQWTESQKLTIPRREPYDHLGHSVVLSDNTIIAGAPNKNNASGVVYVWKRLSRSQLFVFDQVLETDDGQPGDRFGCSFDIHLDSLVIGAEGVDGRDDRVDTESNLNFEELRPKDASTIPASSGVGLENVGAVYYFSRVSYLNTFTFEQKILARIPRAYARFGYAVATENEVLLVNEHEEYKSRLAIRNSVQRVTTYVPSANGSSSVSIGNLFALTLGSRSTGMTEKNVQVARFSANEFTETRLGHIGSGGTPSRVMSENFVPIQTQWMPYNVSTHELTIRLMTDLNTGNVNVQRSYPDENDGFSWTITFLEKPNVQKLSVVSQLTGKGASVKVEVLQQPLPYIHGDTHVFKQEASGGWMEHMHMRPEVAQNGDLFGASVSINRRFAAVGAPNRDLQDGSGSNSGAIYLFDLGFLNLKFSTQSYSALESAGSTTLSIERCNGGCAVWSEESQIPTVPSGYDEYENIQYHLKDGTATGRADCLKQSLGTDDCLWIDADDRSWQLLENETFNNSIRAAFVGEGEPFSHYDYRAQSDYAPDWGNIPFGPYEATRSIEVVITNDDVNEQPDETINVLLHSPGIRPVPGGDYWAVLTVTDDGDGGVGIHDTYEKLYASLPEENSRFGRAVSIDGDLAAVGAPFETVQSITNAGAVYVFRRTTIGLWTLEERLVSPVPTSGGSFGVSLQIKAVSPYRVIVGAPGESDPVAYVFAREQANLSLSETESAGSWILEGNLSIGNSMNDERCSVNQTSQLHRCSSNEHSPIDQSSHFGGPNAVSIDETYAVVGASGIEAAFVYRKRTENTWYLFQTLRSSDYMDHSYPEGSDHMKIYPKKPLFGASVTVDNDTIVVGASLEDYDRHRPDAKPNSSAIGTTCAEAGFTSRTLASLYSWAQNEYNNAYIWAPADLDNDTAADVLVPSVVCEETSPFVLTIYSNGLPDHPVGAFPLNEDTRRGGSEDNPNELVAQSHRFKIPRFPNVTKTNPRSILEDTLTKDLPPGPIGVALNGVPFFSYVDSNGDDTVDPDSIGFHHLTDLCNGASLSELSPDPSKRFINFYAYKSDPVCLYEDSASPYVFNNLSVPQLTTGKLHPFVFREDFANPQIGQRSPKLGYAMDGFPIFGPFGENGTLPTDLDRCNGRYDSELGHYVYHTTPHRPPYIIGCLKGTPLVDTTALSNEFPSSTPASSDSLDIAYYGRGAAYVFQLLSTVNTSRPNRTGGISVAPKADPIYGGGLELEWQQHTKLVASDRERGDRFGMKVVLDSDQLLVGSSMDTAKPRSTWDFETGDLRGWTKTGTAFDFQPTYEDNSAMRNVYGDVTISTFRDYGGKTYIGSSNREGTLIEIEEDIVGQDRTILFGPATTHRDHPVPITHEPSMFQDPMFEFRPRFAQSAAHRGYFWIGTFENRSATHYSNGTIEAINVGGSTQGDSPQGTLTSDPFQIYGTKLSFLIGGGCDDQKEYIELLIDGVPVRRATGKCNEKMDRVVWDVSKYRWQSGILKIVDVSSTRWGHINVDDIRFNWHESYQSRSTTPSSDGTENRFPAGGAMAYSGEPQAGAVYVYRRRAGGVGNKEPCEISCDLAGCSYSRNPPQRWDCEWEEQQKFQPSDRRAEELFGWSFDIDDSSGVAVVGAINGRGVDAFGLNDLGVRSETGSVYVFKRVEEIRTSNGVFLNPPYWHAIENMKYQPADKAESHRGHFGSSVAVSGFTVLAGAPSQPSLVPIGANGIFSPTSIRSLKLGGAAYAFDVSIVNIGFTNTLFVVSEGGSDPLALQEAILTVERIGDLSGTIHVAYETNDVSAKGISAAKAQYCLGLSHLVRGLAGCGDYVLTSGILTFNPTETSKQITIGVMNDNCFEKYSEELVVKLRIPGGDAVHGANYTATLRIDDDDFGLIACSDTSAVAATHPFYARSALPDTRGTPPHENPLPIDERRMWLLNEL